ncbi:ferredoxin [Streptomyces sp. NPDC046985]|uniref:ferredoxin n=1 Tax=Streptomyces sp. NPDC046985 TaxID=3155377 RepID=UPI0033D3B332
MRLVVDLNRCQGYAQCAFLAPEVFTMHGEEALVYNPRADDELKEKVARAVAACPVQAITADGLDDGPYRREHGAVSVSVAGQEAGRGR